MPSYAPAIDRFWAKVHKGSGSDCWLWTGGGGSFWGDGQFTRAWRFSYELHHGAIPAGHTVARTCGISLCVHPQHLTVVAPIPAGQHAHELKWKTRRGPNSRSAVERFWEKVEKRADGCWAWVGAISGDTGYGSFHDAVARKRLGAHRFAYETFRGTIPQGMHLDHLCRVRACVNPDHLEVVTQAENNRRIYRDIHP